MGEIRVLVVDDHAGLRTELRRLIERQPDLRVVAEAGSVQEGMRLAGEAPLTVVVMDLSLPDGDGITATAEIMRQHPGLGVLGLSRHEDGGHVERMLAAGARGYVLKRNAADELLTAIRTIAAGGTYMSPTLQSKQQDRPPEHGGRAGWDAVRAPAHTTEALSANEQVVLRRVGWGHSNREIAEQLDMVLTDVTAHKAQAMQKLGLRTRTDVLRYAEAQGWMGEDSGNE